MPTSEGSALQDLHLVTIRGPLTVGAYRSHVRQLKGRIAAPGPARVLWDLSEAGWEWSSDEVMRECLWTRDRCRSVRIFVAVVAPSDLAYGMARIAAAWLDTADLTTCAFRTEDGARPWLMDRG